ncbi:MAG: WYL domain-containing protein [Clostridia bacterium]|nr:WYL domain-containing protein [Clostridia bacterium]
MANRSNEPSGYAKQKLFFLREMFAEHTDADNGITMKEIQEKVKFQYGICPDHKTIISDINALEACNVEIQRAAGRRKDYRLLKGKDELNLMEIKILINLVQSSRLLPQSNSQKLIHKLEKLCSIHERKKLKGQVTITNRNRAQNTQMIYAMDTIHEAIESDCQLRFHYFQYDTKKRQILTHHGQEYRVSPYALIYHQDVYYLLCVPYKKDTLEMFRVDRMLTVETYNKERENKHIFTRENIDRLSSGTFGDVIGAMEEVSFLIRHNLLDRVYDRFGLDVNVQRYDDEFALVITSVVPNRAFFGWLVTMGDDVIIVSPENVHSDYCAFLMKTRNVNHAAIFKKRYRPLFAYMWDNPR